MIIIFWPNEKPFHERITDAIKPVYETQVQMLERLIIEHKQKLKDFKTGQEYYEMRADIVNKEAPKNFEGVTDKSKPDWRIVTNYHGNLVDQKVSYLVGEPVTLNHDSEKINKEIKTVFNDNFDDKLVDILTAASNKGIEWVQPYIDEEGDFKMFRVAAEEGIPIYQDKEREKLSAFIRDYMFDGKERVEYWDDTTVTRYVFENGKLIPDYYFGEDKQTERHFANGSWEKVPFIPFKNNSFEVSDLNMYKTFIDAVNKRISDTQNTFDESVDWITILKGYRGQDLAEFMTNLKYYKAISVDGDGGVDTIKVEVPVQEIKDYIEMMRAYIIEFGQGVDFTTDKFGNSPSGIALKFLYGNLDLKAKKLARKTKRALKELLWFFFEYKGLKINADEVEITFNLNRMINELEQTQIAAQSMHIISQDTIVGHHPWVSDLKSELDRIRDESFEFSNQSLNPQNTKAGVVDESRDNKETD